MKPKQSVVDLLLLANRSFDCAATWKGWGSIVFGVLMLLITVTVNGVWEQRRFPSEGWLVALFVLASLGAFAWFRSSENLSTAYSACCAERGKFGDSVARFLGLFTVSRQQAEALLSEYARKVKEACDAERLLYERGVERNVSPTDCPDPDRALEIARQRYEAQLTNAKARVKSALAKFWEVHELIQRFTHYELETSWKPYAGEKVGTEDEFLRKLSLGLPSMPGEGANEHPGQ